MEVQGHMPAGETLTPADRRKQKPMESSHSPATPPPVTGPFSAAPRPHGLAGDVLGNRAAAVRAASVQSDWKVTFLYLFPFSLFLTSLFPLLLPSH